ncbi:hypothetical protein Pfra02_44450 [Pseudomonas fragi]|nr:hypothetical protein Pfra02_44450 [Pseudomonas fragi]
MICNFKSPDGENWRAIRLDMLLDAELNYRISTEASERKISKRKLVEEILFKNFKIEFAATDDDSTKE